MAMPMDLAPLAVGVLVGASALAAPRQAISPHARSDVVGTLWDLLGSLPLVRDARRSAEVSRRRAACLAELPVLMDVLTLGLSAGLSFDSSLELFCRGNQGVLAEELGRAMLSWRLGIRSREEALRALARDLDIDALSRFASVVTESISFGTPLAVALERQAQAIRDEQRSQVEEEIEKVPVKMLLPLGTLIVPAMFLAILGPLLGSTMSFG